MQSVKKGLKNFVDKEQKRVIVLTLNHDDELIINGDNVSCEKLEKSQVLKKALETLLAGESEEDDASYNFDGRLVFKEDPKADFPKLFAKIGGKKWKGGEIPKALSCYMKILGFGLNAPKAYGRIEDKPDWWPKKPKWKDFRNPSKASKEDCTKVIRKLLAHHGINAEEYYVDFPNEDMESSDSSDSSESMDENDNNEGEDFGRINLSEDIEDPNAVDRDLQEADSSKDIMRSNMMEEYRKRKKQKVGKYPKSR